jgi:hypothetical protein
VSLTAYTVILRTRTDRDLTEKQPDMAWITAGRFRSSVACDVTTRYLRFTLHVDAESMGAAVTEALHVIERSARVAGFGYEAGELRVVPSARLEEETMRLLGGTGDDADRAGEGCVPASAPGADADSPA